MATMTDSKKIVHVIESLKTGGAQRLISDLLPALKDEGMEVVLVVARLENNPFEEKIKDSGITLVNLDCGSVRNINFYKRLRLYLNNCSSAIGLIHVHLFPTLYIVPLANRGTGIPMVYTEHSTNNKRRTKPWLRPLEKAVYARYNEIFGISDEVSYALSEWLDDKTNNSIVTINNGVNLSKFKNAGSGPPKDTSSGNKMILMVSRFVAAKDQETLIRSIPYVEDSTVSFCFAGAGETLDRHIALSMELGVADRCRFLGNVDKITPLIQSATIGVQSSHWEGFGLTAIEFMASGVPVIATDVPGLGDIVKGAGLLSRPHDPKDLAKKINMLLNDKNLYNRLKEKGSELCAQYDIKTTAENTAAEYKKILNSLNVGTGH